jgi:hypothetical protein
MMSNLSRGIMLEGISCAGKTSTMYAIKRLFATDLKLERNIIMLGEHYTQVLNSINREHKNHEHIEHIEMLYKRVEMIEQLHEWACYLGDFSRTSRGLYTVFERGLINHIACFEDSGDFKIKELVEQFACLGIEAIILFMSDEFLEKRIRLRHEQMKITYDDAYYKEQSEKAKKDQDNIFSAVHNAGLPFRMICTDSMNWDEYAQKIVYDDNVVG